MSVLKDWWNNLLDRERKLLSVSGILVLILLFYAVIWSPLSDVVADRQMQVASQQKLLQFLQHATQIVQQYKNAGVLAQKKINTGELLAAIEQTLSTSELSAFLKQVQQSSSNQVTLTLQSVPFDHCMQWLQIFVNTHSVDIEQFSAQRATTAGTANVIIVLSASSQ